MWQTGTLGNYKTELSSITFRGYAAMLQESRKDLSLP